MGKFINFNPKNMNINTLFLSDFSDFTDFRTFLSPPEAFDHDVNILLYKIKHRLNRIEPGLRVKV